MKIRATVFLLMILTLTANAGSGINFFEGKWNDAIAKAKQENKQVFLDCYTDWCYWCKVMDKETFTDTAVVGYLNRNFICVKREMEKDPEGIALGMKYHINGYPSYAIFSGEGLLVDMIVGYSPAPDFLSSLKTAKQSTKAKFPGFSAQLDPGYPEFYKASFGPSKKRKFPEQDVVTKWLDDQKDLSSEVCWSVMWRFALNDKYNNWIIESRVKLSELYGEEEVNDKIGSIYYVKVNDAAKAKDESAFQSALTGVKENLPAQYPYMYYSFSQLYYQKTGDWNKYANVTQQYIDTAGFSNAGFVNSASWTIYESCEDATVIKQAAAWMEKVCASTEEYMYEDTYAALLYKSGDYKNAEQVALHAIELGKKEDADIAATEQLLANIRLKLK
jgi:thioredoxin-related protein